jgi:hypothetical protein
MEMKDPESLSREAVLKLHEFLSVAGGPHPDNRRRWRAFIIQSHMDGGPIDDITLRALLQETLIEEAAVWLANEYRQDRELLADYDKARGGR